MLSQWHQISHVSKQQALTEAAMWREYAHMAVWKKPTYLQAFVPPWDVRMAYAMETHGVEQTMLNPPPGPGGILDRDLNLGALLESIPAVLPFIFLFGVYMAAQIAAWLKVVLQSYLLSTALRGLKIRIWLPRFHAIKLRLVYKVAASSVLLNQCTSLLDWSRQGSCIQASWKHERLSFTYRFVRQRGK